MSTDGHRYIGQLFNNQFHGIGIAYCPDQGYHYATFKNGNKEGPVLFSNESGSDYYMGEYINDLQHGFGERKRDDEDGVFRGQYANGERQGRGRFIRNNGRIVDTMWKKSVDSGTPCEVSDIMPCVDEGKHSLHDLGLHD